MNINILTEIIDIFSSYNQFVLYYHKYINAYRTSTLA